MSNRPAFTDEEALAFHALPKPGKLEVNASKPMATQRDLSLAYSPGVAVPVLATWLSRNQTHQIRLIQKSFLTLDMKIIGFIIFVALVMVRLLVVEDE